MSNNRGAHDALADDRNEHRLPPYFAVEYNNQKAVIRRNPNYQETLASIKDMFPVLQNTPNTNIRLSARLEEFNDTCLIAEDLWSELSPGLTLVKVIWVRSTPRSMQIFACMRDYGRRRMLTLEVSPNSTIREIKAQIKEQDGTECDEYVVLQAAKPMAPFLEDDETLAEHNIEDDTTLTFYFPPAII